MFIAVKGIFAQGTYFTNKRPRNEIHNDASTFVYLTLPEYLHKIFA